MVIFYVCFIIPVILKKEFRKYCSFHMTITCQKILTGGLRNPGVHMAENQRRH